MITIIAEKPSVAREIARLVGAKEKNDGYISGNGYAVTWAFGHLVEIWAEEGESWSHPLPVLPQEFRLRVSPRQGCDKQLGIIRGLFERSEYIINAGDAGREGELIQRYIYAATGSRTPVKRLWISSLTDEAIREGLRDLRPSCDYDALYAAGKARNEADWLVGINATRALTKTIGDRTVRSLGRVQTPVLAMVCRRFLENRDFVSQPFWNVAVCARQGEDRFIVTSDERFMEQDAAQAALRAVEAAGALDVRSVEKKDVTQQPPLLYDLTALQREANKRYNMSAQQTLDTAQSLYEKKLTTYPRTGSRYITEDVYHTLPGLLSRLEDPRAAAFGGKPLGRHSVNDGKVTDHHALLPTGVRPGELSQSERNIYVLILTRLLEAVSAPCELISTTVKMDSAGVGFTARGNVIVSMGWRAIRGIEKDESKEDEEEDGQLPSFMEGDRCRIISTSIKEGKTKPKPLYTEATLLEAMEHAGREVDDEQLKDAIKECGLGTPATRAAEIETLLTRNYVERQKKQLVPTAIGLSVYESVKDKAIADVQMTAEWEQTLALIAEGKADPKEFDARIREYARTITEEIMSNESVAQSVQAAYLIPGARCPKCGSPVQNRGKVARCQDEGCDFKIWTEVAGKKLAERDILALLTKGETGELKGFRKKDGGSFAAKIVLQDGKMSFAFVDHNKDKDGNDLPCPLCGKPVRVYSEIVKCADEGCGWKLWRTVCGKTVTEPMVQTLLKGGRTPVIKGMKSKAGKTFDAALKLKSDGNIEFIFPPKGITRKK